MSDRYMAITFDEKNDVFSPQVLIVDEDAYELGCRVLHGLAECMCIQGGSTHRRYLELVEEYALKIEEALGSGTVIVICGLMYTEVKQYLVRQPAIGDFASIMNLPVIMTIKRDF